MGSKKFHGIAAPSADDAVAIAAARGMVKEFRLLLDDGADINAVSSVTRSTALAGAAELGLTKVVGLLLKFGADLDKPGAYDMTPLMAACSLGKTKGSKVAMQLLEAGADVDYVRNEDEMTALKFAVQECKPEVIQALLDKGAAVDGPPNTSLTALMLAARANNVEALTVLIDNGADPSIPCKLPWAENRTALGLAQLEKRKKAVEYLACIP
ncbi:Ankyrin repeats (3 copies) [Planctomycetes bacterium Pan216]|uniref:Ankyrin repeats (3 copies) n=1 Tax=Kolteria novifilia TaxID=2527975 RepID=A0A518B256_9BACT|nr:Ankyrin repeats (3 copies) [Planctomycetes bacterium Pan216]